MNTRVIPSGLNRTWGLFVIYVLVGVVGLMGQATDGNLAGIVVDPSGAVVPGATVEVTNVATGVASTTTTNEEGQYRFRNLLAGNYDLKVTRAGFNTATLRNIAVTLNTTATANVSLNVGEVSTVIEVTDTAALIDTTTAQVATTFQRREAIDTPSSALPMGVLNLSLLTSGVASSGGVGLGEGPVVGGQRPRNNNFTVEGVDNNRKDVTGHNVDVPNEAVAEFSVILNQYTAEFGNGTGGQFNTVLRGGGNEIHGSVFEYLQNRNLNAIDESAKRQGITSNPRYDQNTLGGSIGGPIIKNKLFYYGLYQYNPLGQAGTSSPLLAPTAAGYTTLSSLSGISQTNLNVLKQYLSPAPVGTTTTSVRGVNIPIGILPITKPSFTNVHTWLANGDYNPSENDRIRVRWVSNKTSGFSDNTLPALPAFFQGRTTIARLFTASELHTFSSSVLNEFRFGYNRYNDDIPAGNFQFPGLDVFPNIRIDQDLGLQLGPYENAPQSSVINQYQLVDNLSVNKGKHNMKFGWEGRKYIAPQHFIQRERGDYDYTNLERYLTDLNPDELAQRNVGIGAHYAGNQINHSIFGQDDFRIRQNLSISIGLRWEYKGVPRDDGLWALNSIANLPGVIEFRKPSAQKTAFGPRLGIAYSPGTSGRTSIRAGFGISYDKYFDNLSLNSRPPQVSSTVDKDITTNVPDFLKNGGITGGGSVCSTTTACRNATSAYLFDQQLPYAITWNFGVQHVFLNDYTVEIRYLGTRGVHLFNQTQLNKDAVVNPTRFLPTYLTRPSTATLAALPFTYGTLNSISKFSPLYQGLFPANITAFPNRGNSTYHGLAMEVTKRLSRGLHFKAAYTWSHGIDDSTADLNSTVLAPRRPQDFQNMRAERSSSFLDRRHRTTFNWIWDTPWYRGSSNWMLKNLVGNYVISGTYTYESPQFGTVQSAVDSNLNGDSAGDRAIVNVDGVPNTGSDVIPLDRSGNPVAKANAGIVAYLAVNPNAQYILAERGAYANAGRMTIPTRPINSWDLQLKKQFNITERVQLQLAGQFFNLFNHPQYIPGILNNVQSHSTTDPAIRNILIPGNANFNRPDLVFDSNARFTQLTARIQF